MPEPQTMTYSDSLDALSKIADANGNCFRLKLVRRPNAASSVSQHVATFGDATWQHIADAESWISAFCGGGLYVLQIFDGKDARRQYGMITPSEITGQPRPPNIGLARSASWQGPVLISSAADMAPAGAVAMSTFTLAGEPGANGTAPRTLADAAGLSSLFANERAELTRKEEDLREKERRAEVEAIRRESKENADRLERRITDLLGAQKPAPAFDLEKLVIGLLTAAAPILKVMQESSAETRRAQIELEKARLEREERDRTREAEDRKALAGRPLVDPQILTLMENQQKRAEEQVSQISAILKVNAEAGRANMEAQSVAQRTMLQTIADVAQLQLKTQGGGESEGIDWGKVIQGVASGLAAFAQAKGAAPVAGAPVTTQALPQAAPQNLPEVPESALLNAVEDRIRKKDPPDQIMADLKKAVEDPSAKAEIDAEGGLLNVFEARLGDFAEDKGNEKYMAALVLALQTSGVIPADAA